MKAHCILFLILSVWGIQTDGQIVPALPYMAIETEDESNSASASYGDPASSENENEATVSVSEDNQVVLTYRDDNGNGNLYISILNQNKWTQPEKLNKIVNTGGWEPDECISADGHWLYFSSKRVGGFGGKDIYRSEKLSNGEWSDGTNLGPLINTKNDEQAPVYLSDARILYFSSNGHKAKGFNVFESSLSLMDEWSEPKCIGYPQSKNEKNAYQAPDVTSTQIGSSEIETIPYTEKNNCVLFFPNANATPFVILKGQIGDTDGKAPRRIEITATDNETNQVIALFHYHRITGNYSFLIPYGKNINVTYKADGYLFQSQNIDLSGREPCPETVKVIELPPLNKKPKIILNNTLFSPSTATILPASEVEINNLVELLNNDSTITIKIVDYMLHRKNRRKNRLLSKERAEALKEKLVYNCIDPERISTKGYVKNKWRRSFSGNKIKNATSNEWIEINIETLN